MVKIIINVVTLSIVILFQIGGLARAGQKIPLFIGPKAPIPYQTAPKGLEGISAEVCKACHEEIYQEWKKSAHSQAFTNPRFQAFWGVFQDKKPFCTNCHFPLANQKPKIPKGFKESGTLPLILINNPKWDPPLMKEGVTCAVCHIRKGKVLGPKKLEVTEHPVEYNPLFTSSEFCYKCHGLVMPRARVHPNMDTVYGFKKLGLEKKGESCQGCHMPEKGHEGKSYRAHTFTGRDKTTISSALKLELVPLVLPKQGGDKLKVEVRLANIGTSHRLPDG